jgi:hypothetical protein
MGGWRPRAIAIRILGRYHAGKLIMTVFAGITEFEGDFIWNASAPAGRWSSGEDSLWAPRKPPPKETKLALRLIDYSLTPDFHGQLTLEPQKLTRGQGRFVYVCMISALC